MKMISIIIPYFNNSEKQVRRCLDSILQQQYIDCEILLVDDGSIPENGEMLQRVSHIDPRIKIIRQKNQGPSSARNTGIRCAKGDYITFLDADDFFAPNFLREAVKIIKREQCDVVIGGIDNVSAEDAEKKCKQKISGKFRIKRYSGEGIDILKRYLISPTDRIEFKQCYIGRGPVARLVKSDIAKRVYFHEDLRIGEDCVWNHELLSACSSICIVNRSWYYYIYNSNSATHRYDEDIISAYIDFLRRLKALINDQDNIQFRNYCICVSDGLVHAYDMLLCRKEWEVSQVEKREILKDLYTTDPWSVLKSKRCFAVSDRISTMKWLLYRFRLFFPALYVQRRLENIRIWSHH